MEAIQTPFSILCLYFLWGNSPSGFLWVWNLRCVPLLNKDLALSSFWYNFLHPVVNACHSRIMRMLKEILRPNFFLFFRCMLLILEPFRDLVACVCRLFSVMWVDLSLKEKTLFFWEVELKVLCPRDFCPVSSKLFVSRKITAPFLLHSHLKKGTSCTKFSKSKATHVLSRQDKNVGQPSGSSTALS